MRSTTNAKPTTNQPKPVTPPTGAASATGLAAGFAAAFLAGFAAVEGEAVSSMAVAILDEEKGVGGMLDAVTDGKVNAANTNRHPR